MSDSQSNGNGTGPQRRRGKRFLSASEKYEIWLSLVRGEYTIAAAAERSGVDRSTIMKLRPVAQPFGFGLSECAVEQQRLRPDEQVVREHDDLKPHLVERERFERELRQAGVLVVADAVLDMGVLAVARLDDRDVLVGLVGEDRLEAVAVVVSEAQLRAGVRALTPNDHARAFGP